MRFSVLSNCKNKKDSVNKNPSQATSYDIRACIQYARISSTYITFIVEVFIHAGNPVLITGACFFYRSKFELY